MLGEEHEMGARSHTLCLTVRQGCVNKCKSRPGLTCEILGVRKLEVLPKYLCSFKDFVQAYAVV